MIKRWYTRFLILGITVLLLICAYFLYVNYQIKNVDQLSMSGMQSFVNELKIENGTIYGVIPSLPEDYGMLMAVTDDETKEIITVHTNELDGKPAYRNGDRFSFPVDEIRKEGGKGKIVFSIISPKTKKFTDITTIDVNTLDVHWTTYPGQGKEVERKL